MILIDVITTFKSKQKLNKNILQSDKSDLMPQRLR